MLNYRYAEVSKGKRWFVFYMVLNPSTDRMVRKRMYIGHVKDMKLRDRYARKLCSKINDKLDPCWNPFITEKSNKQCTEIGKAFAYLRLFKGSFMSKRGIDTYKNRVGIFLEYLKRQKMDKIFINEFTDSHAIAFFDYLLIERKVSGRTYNNYLIDFRTFFNFFIKQRYAHENPFLAVDELPETEKEKQPFTMEEATLYRDYCVEHEQSFYVISGLCYYCGLRSVEITRLKIGQVDRSNRLIKLPGSSTKSKKNRTIPVPDVFWPLLEKYVEGCSPNDFVCSSGHIPGKKTISPTRIAKKFRIIAREIGLPEYVKFYSRKDTAAERLDHYNIGLKRFVTYSDIRIYPPRMRT